MRFHAPSELAAAIRLLAAEEDARPLAGGQTLIAMLNADLLRPTMLVSLHCIATLRGIERRADGSVRIGAMTTHAALAEARLPGGQALAPAAAARIGHAAIRTRGTLGGAVAHADPSADYPAVLVCLEAAIEIEGPDGRRVLPAAAFFQGFLTTALGQGELVSAVVLPAGPPEMCVHYEKFARVEGDFATVSVAVALRLEGGRIGAARLGLGGCGATPLRSAEAEARLAGRPLDDAVLAEAGALLAAASDPLDDVRGSAAYRRSIIPPLVARAVRAAAAGGAAR
jgi:carbon-monoxide dehydrogenase medium subunit